MGMGHIGHGGDVQHSQAGVSQALREHRTGVRPHGRLKSLRLIGIYKSGLDAKALEVHSQQADAAAVQSASSHHMIALLQDGHQGHRLGGHAAGSSQAGTPALQGCHALFEGGHRGVGEARVHIAKGLQIEQAGGMLGAVKNKAGGLVNRQGPGTGGAVWHLAGVDGQGFGLEDTVCHAAHPLLACRLAEITPVFTPTRLSPPNSRPCSILTQRSNTE